MNLRVAKGIAFARPCRVGCGHTLTQMQEAVTKVRRAIRRGSRLVSRRTPGWHYWSEEDKA